MGSKLWIHLKTSILNWHLYDTGRQCTVYPKKYAHGLCFAVLCCGYTLTDFPISIRLTSLALWQSNDCPSASKATLMNMDKYFMWIHYERLHNHNKAKHNKIVCIFLGIYCNSRETGVRWSILTAFVTSRAAAFITLCILMPVLWGDQTIDYCISPIGRLYKHELPFRSIQEKKKNLK